jgi:uncharacterized repeat protein (TIGR03847 family)
MSSFDLPSPDVFTAGTVGPPGQRVFYLQARDGDLIITVRCEKQQVAALADYFDGLLDDLEPAPYPVTETDLELVEPLVPIWTVGPIGVAYDDPEDRVVVVLEELVVDGADDDGGEEPTAEAPEATEATDTVRVRLTRAQVSSFVRRSRELVAAGRPPCRFCGLPVDPEGHPCPRMN